MSIYVRDLLNSKVFGDYKILTHPETINRQVKRISFNDCQLRENEVECMLATKRANSISQPGDFYIASLYLVKDDINKLMETIQYFVIGGSAGLCIINEYMDSLPESIIKYANENSYPIVLIDADIPYAEIIQVTMEMLLIDQSNTIMELKIDQIIDREIPKSEMMRTARQINGIFRKYFSAVYLVLDFQAYEHLAIFKETLLQNLDFTVVQYKAGFLVIMNYDKPKAYEEHVDYIHKLALSYTETFKIGVSNSFEELEDFGNCVRQSISAYEIAHLNSKPINFYKDLNVYKILYPLKSSKLLYDFHTDIYKPLKDYDDYYNSDLIETIEAYLKHDGDYKKTADYLHQHGNTIRYRIQKAKKILNLENNHISFIEQISIAFKIHRILYINEK